MIGPAPTEAPAITAISSNKLAQAVNIKGQPFHIEDKTRLRGGYLNLPKDIPADSMVAVIIDSPAAGSEDAKREITRLRVIKNGEQPILDESNFPQAIDNLIDEKIPLNSPQVDKCIRPVGDNLNWNDFGDDTYGVTLYLPGNKGITGGIVVAITPKTFQNYRKAVLGS